MEANELRLGNFVYGVSDRVEIVCSFLENGLTTKTIHFDDHFTSEINYFTPIPLTEEWLIKLGFTYQTMGIFTAPSIQYFSVVKWQGHDAKFTLIKDQKLSIKHVHQLQNLYFALTGNELPTTNL